MKKNYFLMVLFFVVSFSYAQDKEQSSLQQTEKEVTQKIEEIKGFAIYPNPVSNGIVRITTSENAKKTVQVFDVLGKQVMSRTIISQHLNISVLRSGVYIIKVFEKDKVATRKLVVK